MYLCAPYCNISIEFQGPTFNNKRKTFIVFLKLNDKFLSLSPRVCFKLNFIFDVSNDLCYYPFWSLISMFAGSAAYSAVCINQCFSDMQYDFWLLSLWFKVNKITYLILLKLFILILGLSDILISQDLRSMLWQDAYCTLLLYFIYSSNKNNWEKSTF